MSQGNQGSGISGGSHPASARNSLGGAIPSSSRRPRRRGERRDYVAAGCEIASSAAAIFEAADLIVKVKEPQAVEIARLQARTGLVHVSPPRRRSGAGPRPRSLDHGHRHETVTDATGQLPLLQPMSAIAGRMSVQVGARLLESGCNDPGILLGGVPGARTAPSDPRRRRRGRQRSPDGRRNAGRGDDPGSEPAPAQRDRRGIRRPRAHGLFDRKLGGPSRS